MAFANTTFPNITCSGGLDILTVDAIVESGTGKEYILEVNGTSSGE